MSLRKLEGSKNQKAIIDALLEKPLTYTELLKKTNMSNAALNKHLRRLEKEGVIEKIYKDGKILNVLKPEKFNFREWILNQLALYDVPQELIEKGRKVLTDDLITLIIVSNGAILNTAFEINDKVEEGVVIEGVEIPDFTKSEKTDPLLTKLKPKIRTFGLEDNSLILLANRLDNFSLVITILYLDYLAFQLVDTKTLPPQSVEEIHNAGKWGHMILEFIPSGGWIIFTLRLLIIEANAQVMSFIERLKSNDIKDTTTLAPLELIIYFIVKTRAPKPSNPQPSEDEKKSTENS